MVFVTSVDGGVAFTAGFLTGLLTQVVTCSFSPGSELNLEMTRVESSFPAALVIRPACALTTNVRQGQSRRNFTQFARGECHEKTHRFIQPPHS